VQPVSQNYLLFFNLISEDNIWAGRNIPGIISVLKPSRFKNVFNQFQLPLLPEIPQLSGDLDE
jgi:hypothetical protein